MPHEAAAVGKGISIGHVIPWFQFSDKTCCCYCIVVIVVVAVVVAAAAAAAVDNNRNSNTH